MTFMEYYKAYSMYTMDRYAEISGKEETRWMSSLASPVLFSIISSVYAMYLDSSVAFKVYKIIKNYRKNAENVVDEEDGFDAEATEALLAKQEKEYDTETMNKISAMLDLLETIYNQPWTEDQLDRIALDAIILGTGFGEIILNNYTESYEYVELDENEQRKVKKMKDFKTVLPSLERICPCDLIINGSFGWRWLQSSKHIIRRRIMTDDNIRKTFIQSVWKFDDYVAKDISETEIIDKNDWDMKIQNMMFWNIPWITNSMLKTTWNGNGYDSMWFFDNDIVTNNAFRFWEDEAKNRSETTKERQPLREVFVVHSGSHVQLFVNGRDLWQKPMLWPRKEKPFFLIHYKRSLNSIYGMGWGQIAYPLYKVQTAFLNLRIDISRLNASKPMLVKSDEAIFEGEEMMPMVPWKLIKVHDTEKGIRPAFEDLTGWEVSNSEVERTGKMILDTFWLNGYWLGIQNKVERAAKNVQELMKWSERGNKEFIKSIGRAFAFISKYWILLWRQIPNEDLKRICGSTIIKDIPVEEIIKEFTFSFNLNPNQSTVSEARIAVINQILDAAKDMVRVDWTPILDQDAAMRELFELSDLPEDLILEPTEYKKQMKAKIDTESELSKYQQEKMPQDVPWEVDNAAWAEMPAAWSGLPEVPAEPIPWLPSVPWIQWGSNVPWATRNTNPEGFNGQ